MSTNIQNRKYMLSFLDQVQVTAPDTPVRRAGGPRKERNPINADLRVFADGSVYPSADLVSRFRLEYGNKPADKKEKATGNGFDVIDSDEFQQYLKTPTRCIWISPTERANGKVDLFASTTYQEDGSPKASVLDQGSVTFGKNVLLPMIKEIYGIELGEDEKYIDLTLYGGRGADNEQIPFVLPAGKFVAFVPKAVERGDQKGTSTVVRRENPEFWCLYPSEEWSQARKTAKASVSE